MYQSQLDTILTNEIYKHQQDDPYVNTTTFTEIDLRHPENATNNGFYDVVTNQVKDIQTAPQYDLAVGTMNQHQSMLANDGFVVATVGSGFELWGSQSEMPVLNTIAVFEITQTTIDGNNPIICVYTGIQHMKIIS